MKIKKKRRRTTTVISVEDFEDILLTRKILKGKRLSVGLKTRYKDKLNLNGLDDSETVMKSTIPFPTKTSLNPKLLRSLKLKINDKYNKSSFEENASTKNKSQTKFKSESSSASMTPIAKYLKNEKG